MARLPSAHLAVDARGRPSARLLASANASPDSSPARFTRRGGRRDTPAARPAPRKQRPASRGAVFASPSAAPPPCATAAAERAKGPDPHAGRPVTARALETPATGQRSPAHGPATPPGRRQGRLLCARGGEGGHSGPAGQRRAIANGGMPPSRARLSMIPGRPPTARRRP